MATPRVVGELPLQNILTFIPIAQSHISPDQCTKNQEYFQCTKKISSKLIVHKMNARMLIKYNFTN